MERCGKRIIAGEKATLCSLRVYNGGPLQPARRFLLHHLCCPGLIRLMEYDAAHGTEYTAALRTFVEEKYSVTHTADKLFVHRTTLLKHLKKIDDITNLDLDDWNTRLHLALSFQFLAG